ncbi:uncharacterized protein [Malus domestica]|uniref:uncharacterized protein n=1 Tax=Malus domestica TaxID=3750 RepID=UPI0039765F18
MATYEALYGRKCKSPLYWDEVGECRLLGPELIQIAADKISMIRAHLLAAQSRQQSYANSHREVTFNIGEYAFLRVSPMKGVFRFGRKGKLSPRFIGPFEVKENLTYKEYPVEITDRREKALRTKTISLVSVLWNNHGVEEST